MNESLGFKNVVEVIHRDSRGNIKSRQKKCNLVTNAGLEWLKGLMANSGSGQSLYIGLTATAITPATGDTTLSGEITSNGCSRATGTYTSGATGVFTVANTFTATGSQTVASAGLFTASSSGTLFAEVALSSSASLVTNDTLQITWTVTLTGS